MNRRQKSNDRRPRRGFTLVELLVSISCAAALIGIVTVLLVAVLRASGHSRDHATRLGSIARLAEKFRADVTTADVCQPADPADLRSGIVLKGPGGRRVEYLSTAHQLRRLAYEGAHIQARETYALGETEQARWEIGQERPILISCVLERTADRAGSTAAGQISISAVLSRDLRFAASDLSADVPKTTVETPDAKPQGDTTDQPDNHSR